MPSMERTTLTDDELAYLRSQPLGRLATVDPSGAPQNNPVGFWWNDEHGTIDIGGRNLPATRKYRNVGRNPQVALVVDDLVSTDPWEVRGIEIRGPAEALDGGPSARPGMSDSLIRIRPERVISWNVEHDGAGMSSRTVSATPHGEVA